MCRTKGRSPEGSINLSGKLIKTRQLEGREWWLWAFAVLVTLVLTAGIVSLTFFSDREGSNPSYWSDLRDWVRGLAALVLIFDIYTMYQHLQLQRMRRELVEHDQLFQLITENAADMIAVVDGNGVGDSDHRGNRGDGGNGITQSNEATETAQRSGTSCRFSVSPLLCVEPFPP